MVEGEKLGKLRYEERMERERKSMAFDTESTLYLYNQSETRDLL